MNIYYYCLLVLTMSMCQATFNGFDMSMDKPITGLPMIPDQLYAAADSDPVQKASVPQKKGRTRRALYRQANYRMIAIPQYNDTLFPWATYRKKDNKRIENF